MRAARRIALLAGAVALAAAPARAQGTGWEGCYDVDVGPWDRNGDGGRSFTPPPRVLLDSVPNEEQRSYLAGTRELRTAPGSPPSRHEFNHWRPLGADSVELRWSTGFAGLTAQLGRSGDGTLRGKAHTHIDILREPPDTAQVVARPVDCASPMPPEHATWTRYPIHVVLATGDTLAAGRPLPQGLKLQEHRNGLWILDRPSGIFEGADRVLVYTREGRMVGNLHVVYDPPADREAILARLEAALGPPTMRSSYTHGTWDGLEGEYVSLGGPMVGEPPGQLVVTLTPPR